MSTTDENIFAGITSMIISMLNLLKEDEGSLDSITLSNREIYYYYDQKLITILESDRSNSKDLINGAIKRIHTMFRINYYPRIRDDIFVDESVFSEFKKNSKQILTSFGLISL